VTHSIRLGTLLNCVLYRSAFEVARQAADVDRMSNGRVILGVRAGDDEVECRQLGINMPPARERVRLLGEMIQSVKGLWGETTHRHTAGSRHHLQPGPVQSPRVPILIAGVGRRTLRHVAEYADGVNLPPTVTTGNAMRGLKMESISRADVEQKLAILEMHCSELSRPLSSFVRSHMASVVLAETPTRLAVLGNDTETLDLLVHQMRPALEDLAARTRVIG
jgi:luciferase-like monooxygenase